MSKTAYRANPTWAHPPLNWRVFMVVLNQHNQVVGMTPASESLSERDAKVRAQRLSEKAKEKAS